MNLRQQTFSKVSNHLDEAVKDLELAASELKDSIYWSNTTEYADIRELINKAKSLSRDFTNGI